MKTLLTFLFLFVAVAVHAANPAFTDFNSNQFDTTGNKVAVESGAILTNINMRIRNGSTGIQGAQVGTAWLWVNDDSSFLYTLGPDRLIVFTNADFRGPIKTVITNAPALATDANGFVVLGSASADDIWTNEINHIDLLTKADFYSFAENNYNAADFNASSNFWMIGMSPMAGAAGRMSRNIFGVGNLLFENAALSNVLNLYAFGNSGFGAATITNSSEIYSYSANGFFSTLINDSGGLYAYAGGAFTGATISNSSHIFALGNDAFSGAVLENVSGVVGLGDSAGAGQSSFINNSVLLGGDTKLIIPALPSASSLATDSNGEVIAGVSDSLWRTNSATGAITNLNGGSAVLGLRHTNLTALSGSPVMLMSPDFILSLNETNSEAPRFSLTDTAPNQLLVYDSLAGWTMGDSSIANRLELTIGGGSFLRDGSGIDRFSANFGADTVLHDSGGTARVQVFTGGSLFTGENTNTGGFYLPALPNAASLSTDDAGKVVAAAPFGGGGVTGDGTNVVSITNGPVITLTLDPTVVVQDLTVTGTTIFSNVVAHAWSSTTNAWAGPTNTLSLALYDQAYKTLVPIQITNLSGWTLTNRDYTVLQITNAASTNVLFRTPADWIFEDRTNTHYVSAGSIADLFVKVGPNGTNASFLNYDGPQQPSLYGNGANLTNTVDIIAGTGIKVETNANNRSFTISQTNDWDVIITKTSNQSVTNSATVESDTQLTTALTSNAVYVVELYLVASGNATAGDYKGRFSCPTVTAGTSIGTAVHFNTSAAATSVAVINGATELPSPDLGFAGTAADTPLTATLRFNFRTEAASGNLTWQFANNAADVGRTSTTWAGSTLKVKKLYSAQ